MYENILLCNHFRPPKVGSNVCFLINENDKHRRSKLATLYTVESDLKSFVRGLKQLKDVKSQVMGNLIIVDYCTNIPFNQKIFYIAKIFRNRKKVYLYSNNLSRFI